MTASPAGTQGDGEGLSFPAAHGCTCADCRTERALLTPPVPDRDAEAVAAALDALDAADWAVERGRIDADDVRTVLAAALPILCRGGAAEVRVEWGCRTCGVGTDSDAPDDTRPAVQRVAEHVNRREGWHDVTTTPWTTEGDER